LALARIRLACFLNPDFDRVTEFVTDQPGSDTLAQAVPESHRERRSPDFVTMIQ
jgi:hypothetical protein